MYVADAKHQAEYAIHKLFAKFVTVVCFLFLLTLIFVIVTVE